MVQPARPALRIGPVALEGRVVLAPMSGITDAVFRRVALRHGASLAVSEMVASDQFVRGAAEAVLRAEGDGIAVHAVQLAGCQPGWMGEAARLAEGAGAALIDIGGESTRPGAAAVWEGDEIKRVVPVVERLAGAGAAISVDTRRAAVMEAALAAGQRGAAAPVEAWLLASGFQGGPISQLVAALPKVGS